MSRGSVGCHARQKPAQLTHARTHAYKPNACPPGPLLPPVHHHITHPHTMRATAFLNTLVTGFAVALALATSPVSAAPDLTCTHTVFFDITHGSKDVGRVSGVDDAAQQWRPQHLIVLAGLVM